jgi:L-lactate dehydrogenase complex protein LldF
MRTRFLRQAARAIEDENLQRALDQNAEKRVTGRREAFSSLPNAGEVKARAHQIRAEVVENLPEILNVFSRNMETNGWIVHHAASAQDACKHISHIAAEHNTSLVIKSKSMVTEEIRLNQALSKEGIEAIETDLGEFIVQLRGEPPGHIITPAIHLMREDVARTFVEHLGIDFTTDVAELNQAARHNLRQAFQTAGIGISGVNFGVVDPGAICIVTNEGNGRMVTTMPNVHIAVMGIERIVPSLQDLAIMLQLLPRSATGQILTSYVSWIRSPRRSDDLDGPSTRHLILVDNGRSNLRQSSLKSALLCIRCGACLNACPVYREVGGHTYGSIYPGPIGSVVSPGFFGMEKFGHLAKASTLCGACLEACPVDIDLPVLLLRTRDQYIRTIKQPPIYSLAMKTFSWVSSSPGLYALAIKSAALLTKLLPAVDGWVKSLPGPFGAWTKYRDFPQFQSRPFRDRFEPVRIIDAGDIDQVKKVHTDSTTIASERSQSTILDRFSRALELVDGELHECTEDDLGDEVMKLFGSQTPDQVLIDPEVIARFPQMVDSLKESKVDIQIPALDNPATRDLQKVELDRTPIGITLALGALADSGSVIVTQDHENAAITSLLPDTHIAILPTGKVFETLMDWIFYSGNEEFTDKQSLTIITGPSRTADIEMTLTLGVHGPGRLIVLAVA